MRHVAEANTADAVLRQDATGAAVDDVARAYAHRRCVAGQLLQAHASSLAALIGAVGINQSLLELQTLLGVACNDFLALLVLSDHALLSHD